MNTFSFDPSNHPDLSSEQADFVRRISSFTEEYFRNPKFDASHDFQHVMRVVRNSVQILDEEQKIRATQSPPLPRLDAWVVILGALLHDIDDKKYVEATSQGPLAKRELIRLGASEQTASTIQAVVDGVSYSSEVKDPARVKHFIMEIPELAVVQDADRLDAIGAIGIGRCFTFGSTLR